MSTVFNMTSPRTGNPVANQFIIDDGNKITFQSYESTIAVIDYDNRTITIGSDWNYSMTTGKYRNAFFEEYVPELADKRAIESAKRIYDNCGEFTLVTRWNGDFKIIFE